MGAKFAFAQPVGALPLPDIRRYDWSIEVAAAFLGAVAAGLLLMAPLDVAWTGEGPGIQTDLLVMNVPRAAAAGAVLAVVTAALTVALGNRAAWITAFASAAVLLVDHLWDRTAAPTGTLTTVNYIDALFSGVLVGALAVAVFHKPGSAFAYLAGILSAILVGDLTSLPAATESSLSEWAATDSPPLWLLTLAVLALAAGAAAQRVESPLNRPEYTELPLAPIAAAMLFVPAATVAAEWYVRQPDTPANIAVVIAVTGVAALLAALLLPGRDGTLVLLAVAATNASSATVAVPRPDWSVPIPVLAVAVGLWAGRRWPLPWIGLAASAALSLFAALTASTAHTTPVVPVIGITAVAVITGYCFGSVTPRAAPSIVLALAVLVVPNITIALRGNSFGRVAYSPEWFRDPVTVTSATPAWSALAITVTSALALALLHAARPGDQVVVARGSRDSPPPLPGDRLS
ncbi:hypothetical protein [Nocardia sp. NPDC050406]|uniref:hypothetical protein n=1 Tax=Nocardia sp. NPDC050406 TaxID=3364318 RepID=UPI0037B45861